uniref:Carbohydrate-binding protein AQN-1-like n=1 Tax=Camelus bactrianus TaxID=9837 RepID=A0A9W3F0D7_CAMBA|nr:carbohydrate-binding protein AQN-1-like [Camelus bactrianus]
MKLSRAIPWALLLSTATVFSTIWNKGNCGGVLTDPMGRFFNYMGPKTVCTWTILMKPGQRVAVATPFLNLSCNEDYMEIQDGLPGSRSYGKICGGYGLSYCSSSNVMTIKYYRKSNYPASKFNVYFYGETKVREIEGVFTDFGQGHRLLRNEATSVCTMLMRPTQDVTLGSPSLK